MRGRCLCIVKGRGTGEGGGGVVGVDWRGEGEEGGGFQAQELGLVEGEEGLQDVLLVGGKHQRRGWECRVEGVKRVEGLGSRVRGYWGWIN